MFYILFILIPLVGATLIAAICEFIRDHKNKRKGVKHNEDIWSYHCNYDCISNCFDCRHYHFNAWRKFISDNQKHL